VRHAEILGIEMQRMGMGASGVASRTFDMVIKCRGAGGEHGREFTFSSIERKEHDGLVRFLRGQKLEVLTDQDQGTRKERFGAAMQAAGVEDGEGAGAAGMDDEDEDDSDFEEGGAGGADDDDDDDDDDGASGGGDSGDDDDDDDDDDDK